MIKLTQFTIEKHNIKEMILSKDLNSVKSTAASVGGTSVKLVKPVYLFISHHLLHFVNTIFTASQFLQDRKVTKVRPIQKHANGAFWFGFRAHRNTSNLVVSIAELIRENLYKISIFVSLNFSKTFDSVSS